MVDAANPSALSVADLKTINIDEAPRIRDLALADRLGFADAHKIRTLIQRNRPELESYGEVSATVAETTAQGGRPGTEFWLLEEQALVICALSRTPAAVAVRRQIITVYTEWRRHQAAQPAPAPDGGARMTLTALEQFMLATFRSTVDSALIERMDRAAADMRTTLDARISALVQQTLDDALSRACLTPDALKIHRPAPPRGPRIAGGAA